MPRHIYFATAEANSLGFQAEPLLYRRVAPKLDFAAGPGDAMPRQIESRP